MNRREGDTEKVVKRNLDFAKARVEVRHRELECALADITMPEEYRRGLVRYAEAGLEAALVEVRFATESFEIFTTGGPVREESGKPVCVEDESGAGQTAAIRPAIAETL